MVKLRNLLLDQNSLYPGWINSDNKNNQTQYQVQRMGCILGDEGAKRLVGRELLDWPS